MKTLVLKLSLFAALSAAAPALATDNRVRSLLFKPDTVVPFVGKPGFQSTIRFGPDERIENVAVGDSIAWQITPNKRGDHLFLKPMVPGARSNMTVITDKRTYLFDLSAPRGAQPVYALSFEFPAFPAPGAIQPPPPPPQTAVPVAVAAAEPIVPAELNGGWVLRGDKALFPQRVYDDGQSVFLSWPERAPLPAVLVPASDGTEGPVDYRVEDGYLVVDGVPRELILRRGRSRATVKAPKLDLRIARTGTSENRRVSR